MTHPPLVETHRAGPHSREWIVRASGCPALAVHGIAHVGVADAAAPYAMVRTDLAGTYFLACVSGEGRIYLDGRWQRCGAGMACLAPPHVLHAFHAIRGKRWGFAWVRYQPTAGHGPLINSAAPVLARFPGDALNAAIEGLYHEQAAGPQPAAQHHWVELIHGYVFRFAQPWHVEDRLARLWEAVAAAPGEHWNLTELARRAHCSGEHLRRLCRRQLGRSPMNQVTYLRMRHAAALLTGGNDKLEVIADAVGYANPFVFSNTFKKWTGWRPSEYRQRKAG
ncbi:MAG: AraC family transcriptional regulator [Verrucomicrobiae bacterium]|nr:AraC family transcriptional regulator [Verrucomicrobiae bacterium]